MRLLVLLLFLSTAYECVAASSLAGRVMVEKSDEPLAGVNVRMMGTNKGTVTDAYGEFRIGDISPGTYTVGFSMIGFQRVTTKVDVVEGEEAFVQVRMKETPVQAGQVVVTASKREQSLQDVPVSISVLDATQISYRNAVSLDEALRYVPGVNMTGPQINIRGSSGYSLGAGSRVLMLLDGIPFIAGDTGELIFEAIPAGHVDRIEVVKGASSALYGSNALGGVINVITKPITSISETYIRMYGGLYNRPTFEQWKWSDTKRYLHGQSAGMSQRFGDFGMSAFVSRQLDDGYRENDSRRRYNVFLKARHELTPSSSLTLNAGFLHQFSGQFLFWRSLDSALIPPLRNQTDNLKSTRYYVSGLFNTILSDNLLITAKAMWAHNLWGFQQMGDAERTESKSDGMRAEISARVTLGDHHTVTAGIDGNLDVIGGAMFESRTIGGLALYAQDEIAMSEMVSLTLGARFDLQSVGLTERSLQFNPKSAIVYTVAEGTSLRASFGRGFRVPSVAEAFIAAGGGFVRGVPNTDLKPERSTSYEVGITHELFDRGSIDVAAFRSDYENLIEPGLIIAEQNLNVQWRNVTSARVQGVETALKLGFFEDNLIYSLGYTYVYPEDRTKKDVLKYRPRHLLYTNAMMRFDWLTLGGDFRFVSRADRIDNELVETGIVPDGDERTDILVADFRLSADVSFGNALLIATLNVKNAFQRNYVELIGNMMPPRTYLLSLEARF
ncbi:MAG: TonB-dependent receptor [Bacteroidetes bacterium]|nr:TonB-dependent receptor [Bacteroidota bacterium]MCW5896966.1 TonB-dependent receptor [Bacteroidota bacterium]